MIPLTQTMTAFAPRLLCLLLASVGLLGSVADAQVWVRGYTRKDGTYVKPHYRSKPDGNFDNNWSTAGNVNPYTGKVGTKTQPSTRSSGGFTSRTTTISPWSGGKNSSTQSRTPVMLPTRSNRGTTAAAGQGNPSGSRVMSNPFVAEAKPFAAEVPLTGLDLTLIELKRVLDRVDALARDSSIPHWFRAVSAIEVLSKLDFVGLPPVIQNRLQPRFDAINSILAEYSFTNGSDFKRLSDRDSKRVLKHLREIATIDLRVNGRTNNNAPIKGSAVNDHPAFFGATSERR